MLYTESSAACTVGTLDHVGIEWTCIKGFVQVLEGAEVTIPLPLILVLCCRLHTQPTTVSSMYSPSWSFGLVGYIYHKFSPPTTPFVLVLPDR